jgi:hypothetical protein
MLGRVGTQALPVTHSSDTVYLSASGSQATVPIHTPWVTSLSRRPKFLPRMVSRVPPSKGPLSGSICQGTERASRVLRLRHQQAAPPVIMCTQGSAPRLSAERRMGWGCGSLGR